MVNPTNTIKLKRSATPSSSPASLEHGELAINYTDEKLFYKNASNSIKEFSLNQSAGISAGGNIDAGTPIDVLLEAEVTNTIVILYDGGEI
jgi:hypothetical protein